MGLAFELHESCAAGTTPTRAMVLCLDAAAWYRRRQYLDFFPNSAVPVRAGTHSHGLRLASRGTRCGAHERRARTVWPRELERLLIKSMLHERRWASSAGDNTGRMGPGWTTSTVSRRPFEADLMRSSRRPTSSRLAENSCPGRGGASPRTLTRRSPLRPLRPQARPLDGST